jgi:enamine deaminase RidA (YjgF/YER057c/UK114 family)
VRAPLVYCFPQAYSAIMITTRANPEGLATIPGGVILTVATGSRIVHISGQTGVDAEGNVVGTTHLDQSRRALQNLSTAIAAAGATPADVAKLGIYVVNYTEAAVEALINAAVEVFGEDFPVTASTLIGVATLWQPDLLIEIDAVCVL